MKVFLFCLFSFIATNAFCQKTQYPCEPEILDGRKLSRPPCKIIIDISEGSCKVHLEEEVLSFSAKASRVGIGYVGGSNKTPLGEFLFVKQGGHRFGKVLRPTGKKLYKENGDLDITTGYYQGWRRGILVHQGSLSRGSIGCIHLSSTAMSRIYKLAISNYDLLIIQK